MLSLFLQDLVRIFANYAENPLMTLAVAASVALLTHQSLSFFVSMA